MRRYKYAACRSRMPGHSWGYADGSNWVPTHGFGEEEYCPNCTTYRRAVIDIQGFKSPWAYEYPDDYKTDIPNEVLRLQVIKTRPKKVKPKSNVTPIRRGRKSA